MVKNLSASIVAATVSGAIVAAFSFFILRDPAPEPPPLSMMSTYFSLDNPVFQSTLETVNEVVAENLLENVEFNTVQQTDDISSALGLSYGRGVIRQSFITNESELRAFDLELDVFDFEYAFFYEEGERDYAHLESSSFQYRLAPGATLVIVAWSNGWVRPNYSSGTPNIIASNAGWIVPDQELEIERTFPSFPESVLNSAPGLFLTLAYVGVILLVIILIALAATVLQRFSMRYALKFTEDSNIADALELAAHIEQHDNERFEKIVKARKKSAERWNVQDS